MIKNCFFLILILFVISSCGVRRSLKDRPDLSNYHSQSYVRHQVNDSLFYIENNFLKKNKAQNWELPRAPAHGRRRSLLICGLVVSVRKQPVQIIDLYGLFFMAPSADKNAAGQGGRRIGQRLRRAAYRRLSW